MVSSCGHLISKVVEFKFVKIYVFTNYLKNNMVNSSTSTALVVVLFKYKCTYTDIMKFTSMSCLQVVHNPRTYMTVQELEAEGVQALSWDELQYTAPREMIEGCTIK